jgi:hypothetical protein
MACMESGLGARTAVVTALPVTTAPDTLGYTIAVAPESKIRQFAG